MTSSSQPPLAIPPNRANGHPIDLANLCDPWNLWFASRLIDPMLKALIFDFDGLILDTESPLCLAWAEICRSFGLDLPPETWVKYIGSRNAFNRYDDLENQLGRPYDRETVQADFRKSVTDRLNAQPVLPGVLDYIEEAGTLGLKLGIASNSDRSWVCGHLERLGLADAFSVVVCAPDVAAPKPAPDVYLGAASRLGMRPEEAIALEDSPPGVAAAVEAGMFTVAVPNPLTAGMDFGRAHVVADSLASFPLPRAVQRYEAAAS